MRSAGQLVQRISQSLEQFWQEIFFIVDGNSYGEAKSGGHAESSALTIPRFRHPSKARWPWPRYRCGLRAPKLFRIFAAILIGRAETEYLAAPDAELPSGLLNT
jgi:hypothetical protein